MVKLIREPLAPLVIFAVLLTFFFLVYLYEEQNISLLFETLASGFWSLLLIYWIIADSRRERSKTCTDFGFLCVMFFPLSLPWHCFRSRGWRGIPMLMLLIAIWFAPYLIAGIAWGIKYGG